MLLHQTSKQIMVTNTLSISFSSILRRVSYFKVPESEFQAPDFALLICLLQAIGFDLHRIENLTRDSPVTPTGQEQSAGYIINITSVQSGLQAVLKPPTKTESSSMSNSGRDIRQVGADFQFHIYQSFNFTFLRILEQLKYCTRSSARIS